MSWYVQGNWFESERGSGQLHFLPYLRLPSYEKLCSRQVNASYDGHYRILACVARRIFVVVIAFPY